MPTVFPIISYEEHRWITGIKFSIPTQDMTHPGAKSSVTLSAARERAGAGTPTTEAKRAEMVFHGNGHL